MLQNVNLNDLKGAAEEALRIVPANTVVNLLNLAQLSLNKNQIETIPNGAIVLTNSNPTRKCASIFLNNNKLQSTQLTKEKILLPENADIKI